MRIRLIREGYLYSNEENGPFTSASLLEPTKTKTIGKDFGLWEEHFRYYRKMHFSVMKSLILKEMEVPVQLRHLLKALMMIN